MKKVVVIGGGTGNFVVLKGLKKYDVSLSAVVSMADDGGSTGILRDELGVLPPGDVRQCLVALSDSSLLMRSLMNYRFENGGLGGHSFGNLLLSALEKVTGSFEQAIEEVGRILFIKGKVIPVTTHLTRLKMLLKNNTLLDGEKEVFVSQELEQGYRDIYLEPYPKANPKALQAIMDADMVVLGPGGFYTSIIPNLLVGGIVDAIKDSKAKKVYVVNLMNKKGQTTHFKVSHYLKELIRFMGKDMFDFVLVNSQPPPKDLIRYYEEEGQLVFNDLKKETRLISAPLLDGDLKQEQKGDSIKRNLIRHNSTKLATQLMKIVNHL